VRRREFVAGLGGAAVWASAARAQQPALPAIGYLGSDRREESLRAFRQGLSEVGFVESRNVAIEYRWAERHNDRLPALAADLARRRVSVIVTGSTPAVLAAKAQSQTIPIVFLFGGDAVEMGLVASLNRPGGNLTGFTFLSNALAAPRIAGDGSSPNVLTRPCSSFGHGGPAGWSASSIISDWLSAAGRLRASPND
jgi:putative tryptophan/tyrosine transport system substrate-binding protein